MCNGITTERPATEQELVKYKLALKIREMSDDGKTMVSALVDLMEGKDPETTLDIRLDSARELISWGEFIPAADRR